MSRPPVLNLVRLEVNRLPGLEDAFAVETRPGVNLVLGPNESGKSSLVRAVFHLLWPSRPATPPFSVRGRFSDPVGPLQARCDDAVNVHWSRDGDPVPAPEVPAGDLARCYRLGLLDLNRPEAGAVDNSLAVEIRRQMSGGYDPSQLRAFFPDQNVRWSRRQVDWHRARQELLRCANQQRHLADQERSLADLEADKEIAQSAGRRADRLAAAQTHQRLTAELGSVAARLADLPTGMPCVRPGDDETLAGLQARMAGKSHQIEILREEIARRAEQIASLAGSGELDGLDRFVRQAEAQAGRVAEAVRGLAGAAAAADETRRDLPPELLAADVPADAAAAYAQLARGHREQTDRQVRREHLGRLQELGLLQEPAGANGWECDDESAARLVSGRLAPPPISLLLTGVLGLGGAVALLAFGGLGTPRSSAVLGLVVLLAVVGGSNAGLWWWRRAGRDRGRRRLEDLARAAGRPLPAGWTPVDAFAHFQTGARAGGLVAGGGATRAALREELQRREVEAAADLQASADRRRALLQELGLDESRDDAGLLHELDLVARYRAAESHRRQAQGILDHEQSLLAALLAEGRTRLGAFGIDSPATTMDLRNGVEEMRRREKRLEGLRDTQLRAANELEQAESDQAEGVSGLTSLRQRLGLPETSDPAAINLAVGARVAVLGRYTELCRQQERLQEEREQAWARLAADGDEPAPFDLPSLTAADLAARILVEQQLAAGTEALTAEIARIRERIDQARRGHEWEQARATEAEQAADLADLLDERRHNALGRLLLDTIEERHEKDTQPPLLTAMNDHLARFTAARYRLRVVTGTDGSQRFVAVDNADRRLELVDLSDGTRAQLLLAARLAYVTQNENGLHMPLILDEALTASDPGRFDAIAGALGLLAADSGRQVFYLTSSPADVAAWQRALAQRQLPAGHVVDLAAERGAARTADATALSAPEKPDVPVPNGLSAAEYGLRLRVPPVRPWRHESDLSLFHLWKDELGLVHRLRVGGAGTVGQWQRVGHNLIRAGLIAAAEAGRIGARIDLYGAFVDAWRVGRGRPLGREELAASGSLSAAMLPPALDLLTTAGEDGAAFMQAVQDGGIKRLNRTKKDALQEFLEREGHLDHRPVWAADTVVAHVLGRLDQPLAAGLLSVDEVRLLVLDLYRVALAD